MRTANAPQAAGTPLLPVLEVSTTMFPSSTATAYTVAGELGAPPTCTYSENGARCQGPGACKRGGAIAQARRINSARAHFAHLAHDVADHSIFDAHHASGPLRRLPSLQLELGVVKLASDRWPVGAVSDLT